MVDIQKKSFNELKQLVYSIQQKSIDLKKNNKRDVDTQRIDVVLSFLNSLFLNIPEDFEYFHEEISYRTFYNIFEAYLTNVGFTMGMLNLDTSNEVIKKSNILFDDKKSYHN